MIHFCICICLKMWIWIIFWYQLSTVWLAVQGPLAVWQARVQCSVRARAAATELYWQDKHGLVCHHWLTTWTPTTLTPDTTLSRPTHSPYSHTQIQLLVIRWNSVAQRIKIFDTWRLQNCEITGEILQDFKEGDQNKVDIRQRDLNKHSQQFMFHRISPRNCLVTNNVPSLLT